MGYRGLDCCRHYPTGQRWGKSGVHYKGSQSPGCRTEQPP
nr:MAG TPA_asm: hypothetical protein [Caudoviricetes sp.]